MVLLDGNFQCEISNLNDFSIVSNAPNQVINETYTENINLMKLKRNY